MHGKYIYSVEVFTLKKYKKFTGILISILIIFSLVSGFFIIKNVRADNVSNISANAGAVNCIISFTCADSTDSIKIYWSRFSPVTTGDNDTYVDPDDCNYTDRTNRKMLIRGLDDSTTYYYRLWSTDDSAWCDSENSFTTLNRFNGYFVDEFFDFYYVDDSYNVSRMLSYGEKHNGNYVDGDPIINVTYGGTYEGFSNPKVINNNGTWQLWGSNQSNEGYMGYFYSSDGINWTQGDDAYAIGNAGKFHGSVIYEDETYYIVYKHAVGYAGICSNSNPYGGFTRIGNTVINADLVSAPNEASVVAVFNDSLGANTLYASGQNFVSGSNLRESNMYVTLTDDYTDWLYWNEYFDIPTCDYEGGVYSDQNYHVMSSIESGCYVGLHLFYNGSGNDGSLEPFFIVSRDGINWEQVDSSRQVISLGSNGEWDDGMIVPADPVLINNGDYDYMYYSAWDESHLTTPADCLIGYSRWQKDRITYMNPSSADAWIRTKTISSENRYNFNVNFNGSVGAGLKIAVLNASTNNPFSGFGFNDFNTITTDSISHTPSWSGGLLHNIPSGDFKLNFSWTGVGSGEFYGYSMDSNSSVNIQFISINGQGNGLTIYDSTPVFNWTFINNASMYQLQIDDDSDFSSPVVNISNINLFNFPVHYSANTTRVSFELPSAYSLSENYYYCRVQALI